MSTNNHKVNDIVLLTEDFQLQEDTTKVVKLDEEMFGFVFYLSGMISVDVTQNKKKLTTTEQPYNYNQIDQIVNSISVDLTYRPSTKILLQLKGG